RRLKRCARSSRTSSRSGRRSSGTQASTLSEMGNEELRCEEACASEKARSVVMTHRYSRRHFLRTGVGAAVGVLASAAYANRHPNPRPTSLPYLDRNMYRSNTDVLAHFDPGEERGSKMQMMAVGERRFLFLMGDVIEGTDPVKPRLVNPKGYVGNKLQLAYNGKLGKWILMTGAGSVATFSNPKWPHGKYDNPALIQ